MSSNASLQARADDTDDVRWALQTALAQLKQGGHADAIVWVKRAAEAAEAAGNPQRGAELRAEVRQLAEAMWSIGGASPKPMSSRPPSSSSFDIEIDVELEEIPVSSRRAQSGAPQGGSSGRPPPPPLRPPPGARGFSDKPGARPSGAPTTTLAAPTVMGFAAPDIERTSLTETSPYRSSVPELEARELDADPLFTSGMPPAGTSESQRPSAGRITGVATLPQSVPIFNDRLSSVDIEPLSVESVLPNFKSMPPAPGGSASNPPAPESVRRALALIDDEEILEEDEDERVTQDFGILGPDAIAVHTKPSMLPTAPPPGSIAPPSASPIVVSDSQWPVESQRGAMLPPVAPSVPVGQAPTAPPPSVRAVPNSYPPSMPPSAPGTGPNSNRGAGPSSGRDAGPSSGRGVPWSPPPSERPGVSTPPPFERPGASMPPPFERPGASMPPPVERSGASMPPPLPASMTPGSASLPPNSAGPNSAPPISGGPISGAPISGAPSSAPPISLIPLAQGPLSPAPPSRPSLAPPPEPFLRTPSSRPPEVARLTRRAPPSPADTLGFDLGELTLEVSDLGPPAPKPTSRSGEMAALHALDALAGISAPSESSAEGGTSVDGIQLEELRGFEDLPQEVQRSLARSVRVQPLDAGDEVGFFGAAVVTAGCVDILPAISDDSGAVADVSDVVFTKGSLPDAIALRVVAKLDGTRVATWDPDVFEAAIAPCPWLHDELRFIADYFVAVCGAALGPLGERLDPALRTAVFKRLEVRALQPGEVLIKEGSPIQSLFVVGGGRFVVERAAGGEADELLPGGFVFADKMMSAKTAPATVRAGAQGALVLFAPRAVAHELMMSVPPLLEVLAG